MLVLTRRLNEAIQIGENIEVKIVAIEGDQIKLGITAPKEIDVHRKEIYLEIQEQNKQALNNQLNILDLLNKK
ncbi:carbon storage regulator CsrA [Amphibacillus xylanus]|uniref:Translational regulator CsrA n=1 Tax=Amphibacillus xylanus (strain ATCC 51415 / DSM 6626 / JCM 7361 / LMG 17667 / NBRC 15112 / Ep01) TaxID=698758 RepID=K0J561_AMPXN|nr:carbon storage regulator CsrA [Amphibacillus xylanus]BAM48021.1 putative carbon storage regulator [Amphibacillus xylanus NBRC 15112]